MPMHVFRSARRLFPTVAVLALVVACHDKSKSEAASATDSSLARDLAMAQQQVAPQTVFNDAPVGGTTTAIPASAAPTPRPEPAKARAPRPTPVPKPRNPPAPIARSPRPTPPQPSAVAEEPAPAPAAARGIFGVGSHVGMTLNGRVCTLSALAGDKFTATVSSPTVGSNGAVIPAGS